MDTEALKKVPKYRWGTKLAGWCLLILYAGLCIVASVLSFGNKDNSLQINDVSPTPTIKSSVTPQILVHLPENKSLIKFEDFSSNIRNWSLYYPNGKVEVINGKMILQSNLSNHAAIGERHDFISVYENYYVQADFTTDIATRLPYGLVFGMNDSLGTYYLFFINPQAQAYYLLKNLSGEWNELIPFSRGKIRPYPEVNTLSAYYVKGNIELFINGELVASYLDEQPLQYVGVGAYVTGSGYRLIVDNFFAYSEP